MKAIFFDLLIPEDAFVFELGVLAKLEVECWSILFLQYGDGRVLHVRDDIDSSYIVLWLLFLSLLLTDGLSEFLQFF